MRDLYQRLNIKKAASKDELLEAITQCENAAIKEVAEQALLPANNRRNYDQVHGVLSDIGELRAPLGLNNGDNWNPPESTDFTKTPDPSQSHSLIDSFYEKTTPKATVLPFIYAVSQFIQKLVNVAFTCFLAGFIILIIGWVLTQEYGNETTTQKPVDEYTTPSSKPIFTQPQLTTPPSGEIRRQNFDSAIAPLNINTSGGANYLVKLVDTSTGKSILDAFVRGGDTIDIKVPLGTFRLKYATGQKWYGYDYYFGPNTLYSEADSNFRFYDDSQGVSGYTVTLYRVANGNLQTNSLTADQF